MIKAFCDRCEKEVRNETSVRLYSSGGEVNTTMYTAFIGGPVLGGSKHDHVWLLCEDCFVSLKTTFFPLRVPNGVDPSKPI